MSNRINNTETCQNGAEIIKGTSGAVVPVPFNPNQQATFGKIYALGTTNLIIGAITCKINYSSLLPLTIVPGQPLPAPGCSSVTPYSTNSGVGLAAYE